MAFKILTAVLAFCVAQNVCAGPAPFDKPEKDTRGLLVTTYGYTECAKHITTLYSLMQEAKDLFAEYIRLKQTIRLLKKQCERLTGEAKEKCIHDVDETVSGQTNRYMDKVKAYFPKIWDLLKKFKECLFG